MRVVLVGQRQFGCSVLEAFLKRGDDVVGVFMAPDKNSRPDALKTAAIRRGIPLFQFESLASSEALDALRALNADIGVMAYVLQFVPQSFVQLPRLGMIQYHPSLLPKYRGPSGVNWPIVCGETETGATVFRPTDGMDEGPILLQERVAIGKDDTAGSLYYGKLFPLGIDMLLATADLVAAGKARAIGQDETQATFEGRLRISDAKIHWNTHVSMLYNLIRGCSPRPGAWTTLNGQKLVVLDCEKVSCRGFGSIRGKTGTVTAVDAVSFSVAACGGEIRIKSVRLPDEREVPAGECMALLGLSVGTAFDQ